MAQLIDSCCCRVTLRRGTITILILYLIIAGVYLSANAYSILWEVYKLSSTPEATSLILFVKYSVYVVAILIALFGLYMKKSEFLIPVILIRGIILIEDVIDLIWYCFKKRTVIPTSLPVFYTESYFAEIAFGTSLIGLSTYFIIVIYSYYEELREANSKTNGSFDEAEKSAMTMDVHSAATIRKI